MYIFIHANFAHCIAQIIQSVYSLVEFCVRVGTAASSVKSDISRSERGLLQVSVLFLLAVVDEVSRRQQV